jgi:hypothetical protein
MYSQAIAALTSTRNTTLLVLVLGFDYMNLLVGIF